MRVVILSKGKMLSNLIWGVRRADCEVVGVFRYERTIFSDFKMKIIDFFKSSSEFTLIKGLKLHEITCKSANSEEFKREILKLNPDIILVATWKEKLKKEIIDLPKIATINVHPSLLPKYRGPNPYLQTILHGEKFSGLTFHLMTDKLDAGPILAQQKIKILPAYTSKELKERTVFKARFLSCELLKKMKKGCVIPKEQDENEASYYPNIDGMEKMLNFYRQTSDEITNTVRALHPYLPTYITYGKKFLIVNPYKMTITNEFGKAGEILASSKTSLTIACKDGIGICFKGLKKYK